MTAKRTTDLEPLSVGAAQAAQMIGVDRSTIYRLIERGEIRTCRLGGRRLIEVDELRRLLSDHRVGGTGEDGTTSGARSHVPR